MSNKMGLFVQLPRSLAIVTALSLGIGLAVLPKVGWAEVPAHPSVRPSPSLRLVDLTLLPKQVGLDHPLRSHQYQSERVRLLEAIDTSLRYLQTPRAIQAYQNYPIPGITLDRVQRSLVRFRQLVTTSRSAAALQVAVRREFLFYQAVGKDGQGTVAFTGYFEPIYWASRQRTPTYRYPLYQAPPNLAQWPKPHPDRSALEGRDGLQGSQGPLQGLELVWLSDRLEAFLIQVQGSARLQLTDRSTMTVGYAGHTDYPYVGIGRELVKDGKLKQEDLTLQALLAYFRRFPQDLDKYIPRNKRFIFFRETNGAPATGSLGQPVTAGRSIATDKSLFPPGALAIIQTPLPERDATGRWVQRMNSRFVLDHDTGSAIKGPGRVDLFTGTGREAGSQAGLINATGQLYYLLLR
ncbi:MAG: MltA domain-containing protein, partial [Leptolyngbyaceae cyanobacterium bins.59]|nr:MltA domain-containing protein [Leptolyngbyaceae cyanobacterium bins.59]